MKKTTPEEAKELASKHGLLLLPFQIDGPGRLAALIDEAKSSMQPAQEEAPGTAKDCPHAAPHRYCQTCRAVPCPIGLGVKK